MNGGLLDTVEQTTKDKKDDPFVCRESARRAAGKKEVRESDDVMLPSAWNQA